jgi:glycosyltransferase involved in cell wall biosynthesis
VTTRSAFVGSEPSVVRRRDFGTGLSVVIPTLDRPHLLARCLATVARSLRAGDEALVADASSSADAVASVVAEHGASLVRCPHPGASYQRNVGAAKARGDVIAFVDDDVRVSEGWAAAISDAFAENPDAAFVTGRIEVPPEQIGYARPVSIKSELEAAVLTPASRGTLGHSANMAVRREAFEAVGGFDEAIGPGTRLKAAEDSELIDRFFAAGYRGRYEPAALAWHDQWRSRGDLVRLEWTYGIGTGARLARLVRRDRGRARAVVADDFWGNGLKIVPSLVRQRYELGVAFVVARLAGASVGFVRASRCGFATGRTNLDP